MTTDPRMGRHRAWGDTIAEAALIPILYRERRGLAPDAPVRLRCPFVVTDIETTSLRADTPILEVAAVLVRRNGTVDVDNALHVMVNDPRVTEDVFHSSWVAQNSTITWEEVQGGMSPRDAGHTLRHFHPLKVWTSFNRTFDLPRLKRTLDVDPEACLRNKKGEELDVCLMHSAINTLRLICTREKIPQMWSGKWDKPRIKFDDAQRIFERRGHTFPTFYGEDDHG